MAVLPVLFSAPALSCLTLHASFLDYFPRKAASYTHASMYNRILSMLFICRHILHSKKDRVRGWERESDRKKSTKKKTSK